MVLSALIHWVEQFLLIGLISLAIVISIIRAYITKFLAAMRAAGLSPLLIFSLLGILCIYGYISTCARRRVSADEECWIIDLEVVEGGSSLLLTRRNHRQVNLTFFLVFFVSQQLLIYMLADAPPQGESIDGHS